MSTRFTIAQLEKLQSEGRIRGFKEIIKTPAPAKKKGQDGSKTKAWIELHLKAWCVARGFSLHPEYRFCERKWRFDWAVFNGDEKICAIEYEGLSFKKTGHTTSEGYTANTDKYNQATAMGWKLFRYTYLNYKTVLNDLNKLV